MFTQQPTMHANHSEESAILFVKRRPDDKINWSRFTPAPSVHLKFVQEEDNRGQIKKLCLKLRLPMFFSSIIVVNTVVNQWTRSAIRTNNYRHLAGTQIDPSRSEILSATPLYSTARA